MKMSRNAPQIYNETINECMKNVIRIIQYIGSFPVSIKFDRDGKSIDFSWRSPRMLHTVLITAAYFLCTVTSFIKNFHSGEFLRQLVTSVFYLNLVIGNLFFIQLGPKWRKLMMEICNIELNIAGKYPCYKNLSRILTITSIVLFALALLERILSALEVLNSTDNPTNSSGLEFYTRKQYPFITELFGYNIVLGLLLQIVSWLCALTWVSVDVLIISFSIMISCRFKQISTFLEERLKENITLAGGKYVKIFSKGQINLFEVNFWVQIREDYDKLRRVTNNVNELIGKLIAFSYYQNLIFILIQLYNSMNQMDTVSETTYFYYSFGFVIMRIIVVSVVGASVYDESRAFLGILTIIPTEIYNGEIERIILEINADAVNLSGDNFFSIRRGLVLDVAAAIITYELVLIQFIQAKNDINKPNVANATAVQVAT